MHRSIVLMLLALVVTMALATRLVTRIPEELQDNLAQDRCAIPPAGRWLKVMATRDADGQLHVLCWHLELVGIERGLKRRLAAEELLP